MLTNEELINRYNKFAVYYENNKYNNHDSLKYNFYPGLYDFEILKLVMKEIEYVLIKDNKYYIQQNLPFFINIDLDIKTKNESKTMIENESENIITYEVFINLIKDSKKLKLCLKDFISFYPEFYLKYYLSMKKIRMRPPRRLVMISIKECDFCFNPREEYVKIQENVNTKMGYRSCSDCLIYSKFIFLRKRVKKLIKKLRIFTKVFGRLMILFYEIIEIRYRPLGDVYFALEKDFYKMANNKNYNVDL